MLSVVTLTLFLRERRYATLADMMNDAIEVEANLMASGKIKIKVEAEKKKVKEENQPSSSKSADIKLDMMVKTMEKLVERLTLDNRPPPRERQDPQVRNPNFRRPPVPQIRQRDQRNQGDQQIRPPFQENYVEDFVEEPEDQIHLFDEDDSEIYLTKEEHDMFQQEQDNEVLMDSEEYRQGYQNVIYEFQKQYNLRNINVVVNSNKAQVDQPSTSQRKKDPPRKYIPEKKNPKDDGPKKAQDAKKGC
jgi:hypothetical protein